MDILFDRLYLLLYIAQKKSCPVSISSADLVTFAEDILNGNFIFCSVIYRFPSPVYIILEDTVSMIIYVKI